MYCLEDGVEWSGFVGFGVPKFIVTSLQYNGNAFRDVLRTGQVLRVCFLAGARRNDWSTLGGDQGFEEKTRGFVDGAGARFV